MYASINNIVHMIRYERIFTLKPLKLQEQTKWTELSCVWISWALRMFFNCVCVSCKCSYCVMCRCNARQWISVLLTCNQPKDLLVCEFTGHHIIYSKVSYVRLQQHRTIQTESRVPLCWDDLDRLLLLGASLAGRLGQRTERCPASPWKKPS